MPALVTVCAGDFWLWPHGGRSPAAGLGTRDAQKALRRDPLGGSAWGTEGASRIPSDGVCPPGYTGALTLHGGSGWA